MDFSVIAIGDVQNVLSAMQKNLECPICLDVLEEPVSTRCDHVFCRFCMLKLFSKKKKAVIQCPLCKAEVTKRSLKENSRFKQLIEGLLETIHAFELDTGVKYLLTEQCDRIGNDSSLRNEDTSFLNTGEMDAERCQCNSKSKEFHLKGSSESKLDKSKETDIAVQSVEAVEIKDRLKRKRKTARVLQPEDFIKKKDEEAAKQCRRSTRTMCALQLVVDRNALSPDPTEPQIDSYPSSEEPRKVDSEQRQDSGHDTQNVPGDLITEKLPVAKNVLDLTKEAEDSELDTQYLRNIFRHSKRLSFSLYPAPMKACWSETPDGLLCSDDAIEENTSFSETDRRERSAVFVKGSDNALVKELRSRNVSSKPRSRRKAQKLRSSDEESSEDEDFPCFQTLLFGKSSHMSEESVDGAQELKKPLIQVHTSKQVSSVNESKETFQSHVGGLKRSKTNFKDERKEDPNMGANLGEASGYDSETSNAEDTCGPFSQGEILTTQQKNAMQNNLKKLQQEMAVLEAVLKQHGSAESTSEGNFENHNRSSSKGFSANDFCVMSSDSLSSKIKELEKERLLNPQTAEATNSSMVAQKSNKSCTQECKSKRSVCFPISVLRNASGKENATSPVVTNRKEMSIVASGLNQSEHLVVQKFARKTQSALSNRITEGTTHVIMKTDKELVCERTLKYFLGIAGRKWVVSYQWVIQSFKEGRILDEENFEVRGDVINGRNHQGPKRARQSLTEKIFKGFEICCCGPFTDMTTEHLEWMVELCGASVVKQLHLFTHRTSSTAVVVVQPDAWMENTDYRAIQLKNDVAMVTREWVLDSVACYERQEFGAYLVS
ncbi:PREDICTED: breast cancer type 1 susceptibility protein [Leptosomus discolor]|uniref:breast cancer type 1 susceptibility protein n=1 Tax=Leptosomus discolor TaxID=188344 RepID=UPI000522A904|nr:PREDICTED: breast cancer type 1 susceptibility protein [Leptosomus discolor]